MRLRAPVLRVALGAALMLGGLASGVGATQPQPPPQVQQEDVQRRFGLAVSDVPAQLAERASIPREGALVTEVRPGSPAGRTEIREGMVIVELGNTRVENAREFVAALRRAEPGATLVLRLRVPGSDVRLLRAITVPG